MERPIESFRRAVALRYQPGQDTAPRQVATGQGAVADKFLQLARIHQIPVRQDKNLAQVLSLLKLDEEIPTTVYRAVAEILAFVYRLKQRGSWAPRERLRAVPMAFG